MAEQSTGFVPDLPAELGLKPGEAIGTTLPPEILALLDEEVNAYVDEWGRALEGFATAGTDG